MALQKWSWCLGILTLALASPPADAAGVQPNCDMRQLELSPMQKAKMRYIRIQHKNSQNTTAASFTNSPFNDQEQIAQLLTKPDFDEQQARRFIITRYNYRIQSDIEDLRVQHAFWQILNPQQRREWLNNCLR